MWGTFSDNPLVILKKCCLSQLIWVIVKKMSFLTLMKWIYSVSISVPKPLREDWLNWMQREHIPDVMSTGYFEDFHMQELLDPVPYPNMFTFNVQYFCASREAYDQYQKTVAPMLQQLHTDKYGDQVQAFRTLLKRL